MPRINKKDFVELRMELLERNNKVDSRLLSLEQSTAMVDSLIREQNKLSQSIRGLMGTQTLEQSDELAQIAARQDDINYTLRELLQKLQAIQLYGGVETKPPADTPSPTPQESPPVSSLPLQISKTPVETNKVDPEKLYRDAMENIQNESFQLAESQLLSFFMQFPKHELAGNAQYWLGEAVYGQRKYDLAISEFTKVLGKYSKSPNVPSALLKIGFAQVELGQKKTAIKTFNRLIKSYPKSQETQEAKLALEELKAQ